MDVRWREASLLCFIRAAGAPEEPSWLLMMTSQMQSGTGPGFEQACVRKRGGGDRSISQR